MAVLSRRLVPFAAVLVMAAATAAAPPASAAPSSFHTSFEASEPAPTWQNTPAQAGAHQYFRLDLAAAPGAAKTSAAEVELLGHR